MMSSSTDLCLPEDVVVRTGSAKFMHSAFCSGGENKVLARTHHGAECHTRDTNFRHNDKELLLNVCCVFEVL